MRLTSPSTKTTPGRKRQHVEQSRNLPLLRFATTDRTEINSTPEVATAPVIAPATTASQSQSRPLALAAPSQRSEVELQSMNLTQLKQILKRHNLVQSGKKVHRLMFVLHDMS